MLNYSGPGYHDLEIAHFQKEIVMSTYKKIIPVIVAIVLLSNACGISGISLSSTSTLIPPTDTPIPAPWIEGSLVNKETNLPLSNARVVLCLQQEESTCVVKVDLSALTNVDGQFKIMDVPKGKYAILYNASGSNLSSDLNNAVLDYSPQTTSADPGIGNVTHLLKSLGVSSASLCNAYYEVVDGNLVISGYVFVESKDMGFVFLGGDMIYVTIDDSPQKIDLRVWDTQNEDNCEDGEFKPLP